MVLSAILLGIEWLRNIFLGTALLFSIRATNKLYQGYLKTEIMKIKKPVFTFLTFAIAFLLLGFITENINGLSDNKFTLLSVIFFSLAYLLFLVAFSYFWHESSKLHQLHIAEPIFFIGVAAAVLIWIFYLFQITIFSGIADLSAINKIVFLIHPLAVAIIFLLTLIIHPAHETRIIRTPLWYISSGIFMYFLGYMIMDYSFIKSVAKLIPLLYSLLLLLSAAYFVLGFYVANNKFDYKKKKSRKR